MRNLVPIFINICLFFLFLNAIETVQAQQVISTSGNHAENGSAQLSWTVGEIVTATVSSDDNILTQGFHQSRLTVTAIEESVEPGFDISAFPNPSEEYVILRFYPLPKQQASGLWKDYSFQLYDVNGRLLMQMQIESTETVIPMDNHPPSTYFLKVLYKDKEGHNMKSRDPGTKSFNVVKTFKIIKQ